MKNVLISALIVLATGCGPSDTDPNDRKQQNPAPLVQQNLDGKKTRKPPVIRHSFHEPLPQTTASMDSFSDGLFIQAVNHLETHEPTMSIAVCSMTKFENSNQAEKGVEIIDSLCYESGMVIPYGKSADFHLDAQAIQKLYDMGEQGAIHVEFNDSYSNSSIHWDCYEHRSTDLPDVSNQVYGLKVTATQINFVSYSCTIKELN